MDTRSLEHRKACAALNERFGTRLADLWHIQHELKGRLGPSDVAFVMGLASDCREPDALDALLTAIHEIKGGYDASEVIELFERTSHERIRWRIGDCFEKSSPIGIGPWLREKLLDPTVGSSKQMLVLAAAKHLSKSEAVEVAKHVTAEWPGHAAITIGKCGTKEDLPFLEDLLRKAIEAKSFAWVKQEIRTAMKRIRKREGIAETT